MSNAHSHNDYLQQKPFFQAYDKQFGSIETDIHLVENKLFVAHDSAELTLKRTLEELYLLPLSSRVVKNKGYIYEDHSRQLQLLVDIKTEATATLDALIKLLKRYPAITSGKSVRIVITGNRPLESTFQSYPNYIWFDGNLDSTYSNHTLNKIALFSDNFEKYTQWKGRGPIPAGDLDMLTAMVNKAHALQKPVRFWASPDFFGAWRELTRLGVDYINTDQVAGLADFLAPPTGVSASPN